MAKRLSPSQSDGSDDPDDYNADYEEVQVKKRRLVQFESLRLLSVHSTSEIDDKAARVQVYKLSESVRYKNKQLERKERELERLRQRQTTDENTSCTIHRHWINLDEQMRLIVMRGSSGNDIDAILKINASHATSSARFLEEVVQLTEQDRESVYDKRVQTSVDLLNQIMNMINKNSDSYKNFSENMLSYLEDRNEDGLRDDRLEELIHVNTNLTEENYRITQDYSDMQKAYSALQIQLRDFEDTISQYKTRNEELIQEKADMDFELDKARKQVNKLDYRLYTAVKDYQRQLKAAALESKTHNGVVLSSASSDDPGTMEADTLRAELEAQKEISATRLAEIKELNEKLTKCVQDVELVRIQNNQIVVENERRKKDFEELQRVFSMTIDQNNRYRKELDEALLDRDTIRQEMFVAVEDMKKEEQLALRKVLQSSEKISNENNQIRKDFDALKQEYEQSVANAHGQDNRANDYKVLFGSSKAQNVQLKSESERLTKKLKEADSHIAKLQKEIETERQYLSKCLVIELDDSENSTAELKTEERVLSERVKDLEEKLEAYKSIDNESRDKAEIKASEEKLRAENERVTKQLAKMVKMDKKEKMRLYETEFQKQVNAKDMEIDALSKDRSELINAEGALNQELESIGQALEELQEQNGSLMKQKQYLEQEKMKMMGDRISSTQVQQKMKEEKLLYEAQVRNLNRQIMAQNCEHLHVKESLSLAKESIGARSRENTLLNKNVDVLRKQLIEISMKMESLQAANDKVSAQLKQLQATNVHKTEKLDTATEKKLKMTQKSDKLGTADEILMEEIRELKEVLTCPSCKVNRKDAILTKCFHVFCLECIKTRYDTRQRKCPKCNVGFGANDFQRAYIG
ncbi:unnamed protein product [Auanema sp. JU1783]|nr:unnamed protein product [Auanema sp. JU1783]